MKEKVKKISNIFKNNSFALILTSIFLSLTLLIFFSNFINVFPTSFKDRVMGNALLYGIDITKRVNGFYIFLFLLFPLLTLLINNIVTKIVPLEKLKKELNIISSFGLINLFLFYIKKLNNLSILDYPSLILLLEMIFLILIVSILAKKYSSLKTENLNWTFVATTPFLFVISLFCHRIGIKINGNIISLGAFFVSSLGLFFLSNYKKINFAALKKSFTIFLVSPLIEYIFLETYNILNQYNIFIPHKIIAIFSIYLITFILFLLYYIKLRNNNKIKFDYKKIYYPIIILIFGFIIAQINLINLVSTDLFETANFGEGIFEFFKFGKIPLLETFDAHMLRDEVWGILYGILNQDIKGSIFAYSLYKSYEIIIIYIILYVFFNHFFAKDFSLLFILFFPFSFDMGLMNYAIALIAVLVLNKAFQKKNYLFFVLFWLVCILLCLYSLDLGYAGVLSCICVGAYFYFKQKKNIKIKVILLPLIIVGGGFLLFYLVLCALKNINPILRMLEFLKIAMSNPNWAYASLGDTQKIAYIISYYVLPVFIVFSFIYLIYKIKKGGSTKEILLLFLVAFYIFNFQRGIVRHSLVENTLRCLLSFALPYVSLLIYQYIVKNEKEVKFVLIYTSLIVASQLLLSSNILEYTNVFNSSLIKYNTYINQYEIADTKVERVVISKKMREEYQDLEFLLDELLQENETFLDLTNQTLLYALMNREKPVYVNQSPALLSGELSQQLFLEEYKNFHKTIPIVLKSKSKQLSETLDNIPNDYRYYLLSEEIFQNFVPIASINDYEIWATRSKVEEYRKKLESVNYKNVIMLSIKEYLKNDPKDINLKYIPYIWGKYGEADKRIISENKLLNNEFYFEIDKSDKIEGNYLEIELESASENKAKIQFCSEDDCFSSYLFKIKEEKNIYLIRVSTTFAWYEEHINKAIITFENENSVSVTNISLLKGDVLKK